MNDDSVPDHSLPLFLSDDADERRWRGVSRIRKAGLLGLAALAIVTAVVALGYPVARYMAVSASLADASAQESSQDQTAAPLTQLAGDTQASPPAESAAPAAAAEPVPAGTAAAPSSAPQQAGDKKASDALFMQFQAWAQGQDSAKSNKPDSQPDSSGQDSPVQATQDAPVQPDVPKPTAETTQATPARIEPAAPAPVRTAQKRRPVRELRNARAEDVDPARAARAKPAHPHDGPMHAAQPREEAHAQEAPPQSSQTPSLLQLFGWRN